MGWNQEQDRITGAVGHGDISFATGVGGPPYAMGDMVARMNSINVLALWKPFRNPAKGFSDAATQRAAIRDAFGGFKQDNGLLPTYSVNGGDIGDIPHNRWEYKIPRGVNNEYNEPYRDNDFSPLGLYNGFQVGYYKDAVSPISAIWPATWRSTNNMVIVNFNGAVPGWLSAFCLSVDDIIPYDSGVGYGDYCICLALAGSNGGRDLIVSTKRVRDVLSVSDGMAFTFSKSEVDALASLYAPNGYATAAICLYRPSGGVPSEQTIYHVPSQLNPDVVSLEIGPNSDRQKIFMGYDGSIQGLSVTLSNLVLGTPATIPAWVSAYGFTSCKQLSPLNNALSVAVNASGCAGWGQIGNSIKGILEIYTEGTGILGTQDGMSGTSISYPFVATVDPSNPYSGSFIFGNTFPGSQQPYALYVAKTYTEPGKVKAKLSFTMDTTIQSNVLEVNL